MRADLLGPCWETGPGGMETIVQWVILWCGRVNRGCEWAFKAIDHQVVRNVLARCNVRVGSEDVIDCVFNNADAQTEQRRLGVKNLCGRRVE